MIKIITGPMFAGKSTRLLEIYNSVIDKENTLCFKPSKDIRDLTKIRARNVNQKVEAIVIRKFEEILKYTEGKHIKNIFIDEAQFINGNFNILTILSIWYGINIYVAGLAKTSEQRPFGTFPYLMAIADEIEILKAKCACGKEAVYTYTRVNKTSDILIETNNEYIPVCKECFIKELPKWEK